MELLADCGFDLSKIATTPLPLNMKLVATDGVIISNPEFYRSMVGKLNFLSNTRPDVSCAVQVLSQYMQSPRIIHLAVLEHTLCYTFHTATQGILLKATDQLTLQAFTDSDWAACSDSRRSITGYILLLGQSPITWKSKKQSTVSRSSSDVEYRAMAFASTKVT